MSAPSVPIPRSSIEVDPIPADEGLSLLLDLLEPAGASSDAHHAGLKDRVQVWVKRAADWGAGPQGAFCAW
ncbi:hypothetical protein [Geodermatophilus ruber]|uniref:Uncharacterized protein n=1 Tax=Geodermatophilus ruber TaxID=504800 RepID=A0A1I3YYL7_9ACTN|nr:hypothetical protein [Geodermatophilus ruber]SFK36964.1 hypothetical protein SAMN04488085_101263 [Geodermatophilus ruber]